MAVENHKPKPTSHLVKVFNKENIDDLLLSGINISSDLKRQISSFIKESTLVVYLDQNQICGWGFVQTFGNTDYALYKYQVPKNTKLLKNLFVDPNYRGKSIGKIINEQRLNYIESNVTPIVFVLASNKYAIRNLHMYGFEIQLNVKDYLWLNKIHKRKIGIIKPGAISELIKSGFKDEN